MFKNNLNFFFISFLITNNENWIIILEIEEKRVDENEQKINPLSKSFEIFSLDLFFQLLFFSSSQNWEILMKCEEIGHLVEQCSYLGYISLFILSPPEKKFSFLRIINWDCPWTKPVPGGRKKNQWNQDKNIHHQGKTVPTHAHSLKFR